PPYLVSAGYADQELTRLPRPQTPAQVGLVVLNAPRGTTNAQHRSDPSKSTIWPRRAGYIYMRIAAFLEDFAVRRQGVPVRSAQFVRVPVYIRGALRTTRLTSLVPA